MKVYKTVTMDIESGKILSEDSYEYDGRIAECKKGGGVQTETVQSPEAQQALAAVMPALERMGLAGQYGGVIPEGLEREISPAVPGEWVPPVYKPRNYTNVGIPSQPQQVQTPGYWTEGTPAVMGPVTPGTLYDVPGAPIEQAMGYFRGAMPSAENIGAISPDIKAAVAAPYLEAMGQVTEQFGGGMGSARGGLSGAGAEVLNRGMESMIPQYIQQLWSMVAPAEFAAAQTGAGLAGQEWGADVAARAAPFGAIPEIAGGTMPTTMGGTTKK